MSDTLRGVRDNGPDYMITGPWAEKFVAKGNDLGWKVTLDHMTETPPRWVAPLRFPYNQYEVVFLGRPPAQGFFSAIPLGVPNPLGVRDMTPGPAHHHLARGPGLRPGARHGEFVSA